LVNLPLELVSKLSAQLFSLNYTAVIVENLESLGDSIPNATILSWNKKVGDQVNEDDVIAVVETDKVEYAILLFHLKYFEFDVL
jgi:hypothetical protein